MDATNTETTMDKATKRAAIRVLSQRNAGIVAAVRPDPVRTEQVRFNGLVYTARIAGNVASLTRTTQRGRTVGLTLLDAVIARGVVQSYSVRYEHAQPVLA